MLVASILFMLALPAMYAHQAEAASRPGLVGYVLLEIGNVLYLVYAGGRSSIRRTKGSGTAWPPFSWRWRCSQAST
jgi:hypothetical protein